MNRQGDYVHFCSAETDSAYAVGLLRRQKEKGALTRQEERMLIFMERRMSESTIYLAPAVIYAAANQKNSCSWLERQDREQKSKWYQKGVQWMRAYPAFLERFGWKERYFALLAAGIIAGLEEGRTQGDKETACHFLQGSWGLLWKRMRRCARLTVREWDGMKEPWRDSKRMDSGMSGVLLFTAGLQKKEFEELDRIWDSILKLREFVGECLQESPALPECIREPFYPDDEKLSWLLGRFRNPQRPAYIHEKKRFSSEWLESLYEVMELAGLPAGACETACLSCQEISRLVDMMGEKRTERQYMTFLMLYCVSRELAQAGRIAAAAVTQDRQT